MKPVLIDCDPGTDDALAIFMALNCPDLDVIGLTTVGGNADIGDTTANALALLESVDRAEVPVWKGAANPLAGDFSYAYDYHGEAGLGLRLRPPTAEVRPEPAVDAIIAAAHEWTGGLTLLALGPLTNVASALRQHPALALEIAEIIAMGGALQVPGNVTDHAEFNIYNDPEAAAIVCDSGAPVTLLGLDVTTQVALAAGDDPWKSDGSKTAVMARRILRIWFSTHPAMKRYSLHDPLTVAALIDPGLLTCRQGSVAVEVGNGQRRGKTTATYEGGNVRAALGVDVDRTETLIESLIRGAQ